MRIDSSANNKCNKFGLRHYKLSKVTAEMVAIDIHFTIIDF